MLNPAAHTEATPHHMAGPHVRRENLAFAALLRLPRAETGAAEAVVDAAIETLQLAHVQVRAGPPRPPA
jgi:hypothetical protein